MAYHSCKNCNHPFGTSYKYCPNCGLKQADTLTIKALFNNTIQNYFAFDARFFKSFVPLLFRPGFLPKQFVAGKRLTYLHPAQLYLFSTILFFFIFSFQAKIDAEDMDASINEAFSAVSKENREVKLSALNDSLPNTIKENDVPSNTDINFNFGFNEKIIDSLIAINVPDKEIYKVMGQNENSNYFTQLFFKQSLRLYKTHSLGGIYKRFIDSLPIALFFLLPIFALLLKLFYFKRLVYVNHLVFSFYYFAYAFFMFSIIFVLNYIVDLGNFNFLIFLWLFVYLVIAIKNYYNKHLIATFFKTIALVVTYCLFVIPIALTLTLVFSFLFY